MTPSSGARGRHPTRARGGIGGPGGARAAGAVVLPAGGRYFYKGPPGSTVQYERDEIDELLGLRVLLLKMDAPAAAVAVCLHCKTTTESFTHSSRQSSRVPSERLGSQVREVRGIAREVWNSPTLSWTSPSSRE